MKTEEKLAALETELELLWDKIQELKLTDSFAASILYNKYRRKLEQLPPPIPTQVMEDQAVS